MLHFVAGPRTLSYLLIAAAATSCVARAKSNAVDLQNTRSGQAVTALALTLEVKGARADLFKESCELIVSQSWRSKEWSIPISNSANTVIVSLPAGTYQPKKLLCGPRQGYDVSRWKDRLEVHAGKVSYAGHLEINALSPQQVKVGLGAVTSKAQEEFRKVVESSSTVIKENVVSSWTAKNLTLAMLQEKPYGGIQYTWKSTRELTGREELTRDLRRCEHTEINRNRVLFGRLKMTALYLKGRFANTQLADTPNTYSDEFISCLQSSLKAFSVTMTEPVSVTVEL